MIHHLDIHVRELNGPKRLFDALAPGLDFRCRSVDEDFVGYEPTSGGRPRFGIQLDPEHVPGSMRIAFEVDSAQRVDELGAAARSAGARAIEGPGPHPEYGDDYYAVFFEDDQGNKYEILRR
jgi:catechol 2,3-dioxygenase-like lactoylglutathione lyase family enzyme